jgi:hypothetical protein
MSELHWQKSSYSQEASSCVYVAAAPDTTVRLRESDEPDLVLQTSRNAMAALIAAVKTSCLEHHATALRVAQRGCCRPPVSPWWEPRTAPARGAGIMAVTATPY